MTADPDPASSTSLWRRALRKFADFAYAMEVDEAYWLGRRIDGLEAELRSLSSRVGPPLADKPSDRAG
ncbi:hypothetical protein [Sphingopyxis chilensis]|uniref:hypothetical protein n=1 Tax=Sphingopyxis chilensis TaxID=180400 RepID=UPI002DDD7D88|nr:hypothetical protein [Sphingopyxis chilensis]